VRSALFACYPVLLKDGKGYILSVSGSLQRDLEALFVLYGGNMSVLIQSTFVLVLFVLVRCADLSISSAIARGYIRAVCYGIVALLALIYIVIALFIR
jgi:hypothetical protein